MINHLTETVIGAAIEVHRELGPGLLEMAYEAALCCELETLDVAYRRQVHLPLKYKGRELNCNFRLDLVIDNQLIIELKACDNLLPIHKAQLLTYLKLTGIHTGLLINFNVPVLKQGICRLVL